jgi:hypothetical protein
VGTIDIIIKAETEGLDTEAEVVEYAVALLDTQLYKSQGSAGRFLAALQQTELWRLVEMHYEAERLAQEPEEVMS